MYILQQSDFIEFNNTKQNFVQKLNDAGIEVVPVPNGINEGRIFTPDGTYNLDYSFFAPGSEDFLQALKDQGFFDNLQQA